MTRFAKYACAAVLACTAPLTLSGCDNSPSATPMTPTSTTPPFPYPPFEVRTELAVPLAQPLADAAEFALQRTADLSFIYQLDENERYQTYLGHVTPRAGEHIFRGPTPWVGATGGRLLRAVAAQQLTDGVIEVTVCSFETPGRYVMEQDGKLIPTPKTPQVSSDRPQVIWTSGPAADGSTPAKPRWLLVDRGRWEPSEQQAAECDPFKPEPFVQQPPKPIR